MSVGGAMALDSTCLKTKPSARPWPSARLRGIRFGELDRAALELEFDIVVKNPYAVDLPLTSMTYSLRIKKSVVVTGSARPNTIIAAGAKACDFIIPDETALTYRPGSAAELADKLERQEQIYYDRQQQK